MKIIGYQQAIDYLESFIGRIQYKIDPKTIVKHDPLERMRVLLSLLGNPQNKFKSVLIGGTSGKGSTAYLTSHILKLAGYKTGLTISPHLQRINERLQINGEQISDREFVKILNSILSSIEGMKNMDIGAPSYFEILIAMAFMYFALSKADIAVIEVGMGGEFDATNTLYPLVAVLTNVSLDHTDMLGNTIEKIAKTKAGIIKSGSTHSLNDSSTQYVGNLSALHDKSLQNSGSVAQFKSSFREESRPLAPIVITGVRQASVVKIVEERCKEVGAKAYRLGKDFNYKIKKESLGGSVFDLISFDDREEKLKNLRLSLLGKHQIENASLAIEVVLQLKKFGFKTSEKTIRQALSTSFFPGRFEIIPYLIHNTKYKILLDGAHNPTKMHAFLSSLNKLFPTHKKIIIVGFKFDKDIHKMLSQITKVADQIIVTEFKNKTDMKLNASADAESIKYQVLSIKYGGKVFAERDSREALSKALGLLTIEQYNNRTIIIVTGSLYLVGEIRNQIYLS